MEVTVGDILTRKIVYVSPGDTALMASQIMGERDISCVLVLDGKNIRGIVSEADIVSKVVAPGNDPSKTLCQSVMSRPIIKIGYENTLEEASRLMRDNRIKHLVAVKGPRAMGVISSYDIVVAEPVARI
jgi:CBS domain-containing protein